MSSTTRRTAGSTRIVVCGRPGIRHLGSCVPRASLARISMDEPSLPRRERARRPCNAPPRPVRRRAPPRRTARAATRPEADDSVRGACRASAANPALRRRRVRSRDAQHCSRFAWSARFASQTATSRASATWPTSWCAKPASNRCVRARARLALPRGRRAAQLPGVSPACGAAARYRPLGGSATEPLNRCARCAPVQRVTNGAAASGAPRAKRRSRSSATRQFSRAVSRPASSSSTRSPRITLNVTTAPVSDASASGV